MMPTIIAEIDNATIGLVVQSLTAILMLVLAGKQLLREENGKQFERQVEPTEMHAITSELKSQTSMLSNINREVGEVKVTVGKLETEMGGMHHRVGGISRDLAAAEARVAGLEKREGR